MNQELIKRLEADLNLQRVVLNTIDAEVRCVDGSTIFMQPCEYNYAMQRMPELRKTLGGSRLLACYDYEDEYCVAFGFESVAAELVDTQLQSDVLDPDSDLWCVDAKE